MTAFQCKWCPYRTEDQPDGVSHGWHHCLRDPKHRRYSPLHPVFSAARTEGTEGAERGVRG